MYLTAGVQRKQADVYEDCTVSHPEDDAAGGCPQNCGTTASVAASRCRQGYGHLNGAEEESGSGDEGLRPVPL